jgi:predicted methyltransferase
MISRRSSRKANASFPRWPCALGDENRDKYLAIGESDRFLLKFEKPAE